MKRLPLAITLGFAVSFTLGGVAGWLVAQRRQPPARPPSFLRAELNLTPQQEEQIRQVWAEVMARQWRSRDEQRQALEKEREAEIRKLLSPDQQAEYDRIRALFAQKFEQLAQEHRKAWEEAIEKTKQILTPQQRAKFEEQQARFEEMFRRRGPARPPGPPGPPRHVPPPPPPESEKQPPPPASLPPAANQSGP